MADTTEIPVEGYINKLNRNLFPLAQTMLMGQESALGRFGLFLLLYVLPTVVLVSCHLYEWINHARWRSSYMCGACRRHSVVPNLAIFVLRHASTLVLALTNCVWLLASATTWLKFAKLHGVLSARGRTRDDSTRRRVASPAARCQCCMMMTSSTTSSALISACSSSSTATSGGRSPVNCSDEDDEFCSLAPHSGLGHDRSPAPHSGYHRDDVRL